MRVHVTLLRKDLLTGKEDMLAEGKGLLRENCLTYFEKETDIKNQLRLCEDEVELHRYAESESHIFLRKNGESTAEIHSPWGSFTLPAELYHYQRTEAWAEVEYRILSGGEVSVHLFLKWEFTPFSS